MILSMWQAEQLRYPMESLFFVMSPEHLEMIISERATVQAIANVLW